jgi:hypothetical protein
MKNRPIEAAVLRRQSHPIITNQSTHGSLLGLICLYIPTKVDGYMAKYETVLSADREIQFGSHRLHLSSRLDFVGIYEVCLSKLVHCKLNATHANFFKTNFQITCQIYSYSILQTNVLQVCL